MRPAGAGRRTSECLFRLLYQLYGQAFDFIYHLERTLDVVAGARLARPAELKALDSARESEPNWYQFNRMVGGVCYVDLFAGNLSGIREKIPYLEELGLTYLHLMPLFKSPQADCDGGYAVSSYRDVNPALGTLDELRELATELRHYGISLVLDFIFNHTSVEVMRLDAVAFIWKQLGTNCENLPRAHLLIQAFNALCSIAAPALLFKSEAIVHPDEVVKYIGAGECRLSYNPLLMALLWNSLATRKVRLLTQAMRDRFATPTSGEWVNYVRGHDDIGWTFSNDDAALLGVQANDRRHFLNQFYTGRFPGSFARGLPFQENPRTGDGRISGTCASLAGLEQAQAESGPMRDMLVDQATTRIVLIHSIILTVGGLPLIYLGDEIGMLNDYTYRDDPAKAGDSRWVQRPRANWANVARRTNAATIEGRLFGRLRRTIKTRLAQPAFTDGALKVVEARNDHVFGYVRQNDYDSVLVLANFSEREQTLSASVLRPKEFGPAATDLVSGESVALVDDLKLEPYQFMCLRA